MIVCPHCKPGRKVARASLPRSRVVETREIHCMVVHRGAKRRTSTVMRLRECVRCRYRWKTSETIYRGIGKKVHRPKIVLD